MNGIKLLSILTISLLASCVGKAQEVDKRDYCKTNKACEEISITSLEAKSEKNYADCIQLAILYSNSSTSEEKVGYWLTKAIECNAERSCETIKYLQQKSFFNGSIYDKEINNVLKTCEADEI